MLLVEEGTTPTWKGLGSVYDTPDLIFVNAIGGFGVLQGH